MPAAINCRGKTGSRPELTEQGLLQLDSFKAPGLIHGFADRHGGLSPAPFSSSNISFGVGDEARKVEANRATLKQRLGFKTMVSARQVHGNRVLLLDKLPERDFEAEGYDGLVTDQPIALMIQQADCQAVLLHDPVRQVIGAAHAGWRGSVADILGATVGAMAESFGSNPADLTAAISPSLGPCCGEFVNYRQELPAWMYDFQVRPDYFDFWAISRAQLQEAGLQPGNIFPSRICTCCNQDYFSYRRTKVTGRCASVIGLVNG